MCVCVCVCITFTCSEEKSIMMSRLYNGGNHNKYRQSYTK